MEQLIREAEHTINPPRWFGGGIQSDDCCAPSKIKGSNFGCQHKSVSTKLPNCTQEPMAVGAFVTLK